MATMMQAGILKIIAVIITGQIWVCIRFMIHTIITAIMVLLIIITARGIGSLVSQVITIIFMPVSTTIAHGVPGTDTGHM